ncbi:MAG: hypothetical protein ACYC5Q_13650 [Thermoleophilia bacterium]
MGAILLIGALVWGPLLVTSPDEALATARSERIPGQDDLSYGDLVSQYESRVGWPGTWRTKQNKGLRESLFQGDEDGWAYIVTWTAPEGGELWFAVGRFRHVVTQEPDLVVRLLRTSLGPDAVQLFRDAVRR